jgi:O-antigen/teichoic acid export membrane protein
MSSRIIARNSVWGALDMGMDYLSAFVISVLVARAMGPAKLGHYNYVLWVAQMSVSLAMFGIPSATRKYVAEFVGAGKPLWAVAMSRSAFQFQFVTSLVVLGAGLAVTFTVVPPEQRGFILLAVLSLPLSMMMAIPSAVCAAIQDFSATAVPSIVAMVVQALGVLLTLKFQWDLVGLTAALLAGRITDCSLRFLIGPRRFREYLASNFGAVAREVPPLPDEIRRRMVRFCWQSTALLALNLIVWNRSEMFFLRHFSDIRAVAFYSLSFGIVQAALAAAQPFTGAATSGLLLQQGRDPAGTAPFAAVFLRFLSLLAVPITLGIAAVSAPLLNLVYGPAYGPAIPVLTVAAGFAVVASLRGPAMQMLAATDQQGFLVKWGLVMAVLTLALDWWWIFFWGAMGAAAANGVSQLVATAGIWIYVMRRFSFPMPWSALLKIFFSGVVMALSVAGLVRLLPPAPGLGVGVLTGVVVYLFMLRWTRALNDRDRERLLSLQGSVPPVLRRWYVLSVQSVAA